MFSDETLQTVYEKSKVCYEAWCTSIFILWMTRYNYGTRRRHNIQYCHVQDPYFTSKSTDELNIKSWLSPSLKNRLKTFATVMYIGYVLFKFSEWIWMKNTTKPREKSLNRWKSIIINCRRIGIAIKKVLKTSQITLYTWLLFKWKY